jgi:hypothetical protein
VAYKVSDTGSLCGTGATGSLGATGNTEERKKKTSPVKLVFDTIRNKIINFHEEYKVDLVTV